MSWLRNCIATPLAGQNRGVYWVTPSGFPVTHEYRIPAQKRVRTPLGRIAWPRDDVPGRRLLLAKQSSALAPNIIHSLDAAHLALAVQSLRGAGVESIAVVHDSYAVHARYVDVLRRVLRETFVQVHSEDLLRNLWSCARQTTGLLLKSPPKPAAPLNISDVLKSEYMFS